LLGVNSAGLAQDQHYDNIVNPPDENIHYAAGNRLIYTDGGRVIQPSNGSALGNYGACGIAAPDSSLDRVFILGQTTAQSGTPDYTIESFDQTKFIAISSITIDNVVGTSTALIRWGAMGWRSRRELVHRGTSAALAPVSSTSSAAIL
jgi:hypothetical protein